LKRRQFLKSFLTGVAIPMVIPVVARFLPPALKRRLLRPPGALRGQAFLDKCTGCAQCASVCPNQCITMSGLEGGLAALAMPVITPRWRACTLCMACTQICPTGALEPLEPDLAGMQSVKMGVAKVSTGICYSFNGRTCGTCYHACPLPGKAMRLGLYETPIVDPEQCVGCGLCEQSCIHMPHAIRIVPTEELD
jgi:MauM/NapG family ferredoxin protein